MNVLWITLEDTSPRFQVYGDRIARTPNADKLASEGVVFQKAFSTAPVCAPARCAAITGVYAASIGGHHMRTHFRNLSHEGQVPPYEPVPPAHVKCFTEYLRADGVYCTNNEKTDYQFSSPFTAWDECSENAHWRNRPAGARFFSVFNLLAAHESGMWPDGRSLETDPASVQVPPYLPDTPIVRESIARHYDQMARVDVQVGRLLDELEEDGLAEDTVVILWSDHGEGLPRGKRHVYDSGLHVPLMVRWPGRIEPGTRRTDLVSTIDLAPTVLELFGLPLPGHLHGTPLLNQENPRKFVHATQDRFGGYYDQSRAVRTGRFKYIRNYHPELPRFLFNNYLNQHPVQQEIIRLMRHNALEGHARFFGEQNHPVEELYDCDADPHELNNLAVDSSYHSTLLELRSELEDWRRRIGDLGDVPESELSERFWPSGIQPETVAPHFLVYGEDDYCKEPIGGRYGAEYKVQGPALVQLHSPTQGASMAYRFENQQSWTLYTGPFNLDSGDWKLFTKAVRIGYRESPECELALTVL
ncbi:sulfatase family protein [Puniceicoccus vermicola]|uniref:Sulfatase n=1 Tax=Puniceicoccus vermicola TaxID=388746 RepID=A0A7X1B088_9BACT|nr:sulfatase [Puniceicoccus vermicola]MBC2603236.1 sulfatase [Puniceicoccus vermicola]